MDKNICLAGGITGHFLALCCRHWSVCLILGKLGYAVVGLFHVPSEANSRHGGKAASYAKVSVEGAAVLCGVRATWCYSVPIAICAMFITSYEG